SERRPGDGMVKSRIAISPLELALDGVEHQPRELLRHALADRAALDQRRPSDGLDCDVPAIARDAFGAIVEAGRLAIGAVRVALRDGGRDWRAVDQDARRHDQVLVDRPLAVIKA